MNLKMVVGLLISLLPVNGVRCVAYRMLLGYEIVDSRIGFGTVLAVDRARIVRSSLGMFNRFLGPISVTIGENARIGSFNWFQCGAWTTEERFKDGNYERRLDLQENTLITAGHFFDLAGAFILGKNSWIAGRGSQFWTHGTGTAEGNITIGTDCYIGSAVRFAPGSGIGNNVLVSIGAVVIKKILVDHALIGGVPAAVIRADYDWRTKPNPAQNGMDAG